MQKDKTICFVLPGWVTKHTGGAEWQCYLLSEEFVKRGWNVEVITLKPKIINETYYNNKIKYFYYTKSKLRTLLFFKIVNILLQTKSLNYYTRTNAKVLRAAVGFFSTIRKKKYIHALAGDDELTQQNFFEQYKKRQGIKSIIKKVDALIIDFLVRMFAYRNKITIAQTYFQKNELKNQFNIDSIVIRNSFRNLNQTSLNKENIILWVGNFRKVKQPKVFINLVNSLDLDNYEFIMIGENSSYSPLLKKKNFSNFKTLGELTYEQTLEYFSKANILINTSITEGFSNTFIQAWMTKTLVISLNADPDNLLSQGLGLFALGNISKLKELTKNAAMNYDKYKTTIEKSYQFAKKEFTIEKNFRQLYNSIKK